VDDEAAQGDLEIVQLELGAMQIHQAGLGARAQFDELLGQGAFEAGLGPVRGRPFQAALERTDGIQGEMGIAQGRFQVAVDISEVVRFLLAQGLQEGENEVPRLQAGLEEQTDHVRGGLDDFDQLHAARPGICCIPLPKPAKREFADVSNRCRSL